MVSYQCLYCQYRDGVLGQRRSVPEDHHPPAVKVIHTRGRDLENFHPDRLRSKGFARNEDLPPRPEECKHLPQQGRHV